MTLPDTSAQAPICFNHCFLPPWLVTGVCRLGTTVYSLQNPPNVHVEHGIYDVLKSPPDSKHIIPRIVHLRLYKISEGTLCLMLFGLVLHCPGSGLKCSIGTLRPIKGPFNLNQDLPFLAADRVGYSGNNTATSVIRNDCCIKT